MSHTLISHICEVVYPLKYPLCIIVGQTNPPTVDGHWREKHICKEHTHLIDTVPFSEYNGAYLKYSNVTNWTSMFV